MSEDLSGRVAALEAAVRALQERADRANDRAVVGEARATADRDRIGVLEGRADADALLIAELQAEGIINREHAANLEVALKTSRRIGAALGILMADRKVSEDDAFQILRKASMDGNRKLRDLAEDILTTGDVSAL